MHEPADMLPACHIQGILVVFLHKSVGQFCILDILDN